MIYILGVTKAFDLLEFSLIYRVNQSFLPILPVLGNIFLYWKTLSCYGFNLHWQTLSCYGFKLYWGTLSSYGFKLYWETLNFYNILPVPILSYLQFHPVLQILSFYGSPPVLKTLSLSKKFHVSGLSPVLETLSWNEFCVLVFSQYWRLCV